jgi:hypothetical protein
MRQYQQPNGIGKQQPLFTHHTTEELLEAAFSMQSNLRLHNNDQQGKQVAIMS